MSRKGYFGVRGADVPFATLASDVNRYVLDNGLVVLTKEVYPSKIVYLSIWAKVGSIYETDEQAGYSHFVEHMLFKPTKKRKLGQMAQEIEGLGGYLNGFTSYENTAYWAVLPYKSYPKAMEVFYDAIFNPLFEPHEVEKECNVIIEEIKMYKDRPEEYLSQELIRHAFTKHRYGRPVIGYEEILRKATSEDLREYYQNYYKPNNCFVLAVGNLDTIDFLRKTERLFKKLKEGNVAKNPSPKEPPQRKMRRFEMRGNTQMGHLHLAFHVPSIFEKDAYALSLLSIILGDGLSSRLYRVLREEKKIVNEITSYIHLQREPYLLFIEAELPPENIKEAEETIFKIIEDIQNKGVSDKEFERAKNLSEVQYIYKQESVERQGISIGLSEVKGDYMLMEKFIQRLLVTDIDEVQKVAKKYLKKENCTVGVFLPQEEG